MVTRVRCLASTSWRSTPSRKSRPHSGQGAARALEEAVALGLALRKPGDPAAALRRYEQGRGARTRRIIAYGRRVARVTTTRNAIIGALRDAAIQSVPTAVLGGALKLTRQADPHQALRQRRPPSRRRGRGPTLRPPQADSDQGEERHPHGAS
jgi:2-polyprenyl-6-methoxyphenol hydroxylase-like FAD-dependent oxidoreductase